MIVYRHESCAVKICNRAAVDNSKYCSIHRSFRNRIRARDWPQDFTSKISIILQYARRCAVLTPRWLFRKKSGRPDVLACESSGRSKSAKLPEREGGRGLLFLTMEHLERAISSDQHTWELFERYIHPDIENMALVGEQLLLTTIEDQQEHSTRRLKPPVFCSISTLPVALSEAKKWFANKHGGYSKYLEAIWNSSQFNVSGCSVHFDLIYGHSSGTAWVQMGLFGLGTNSPCSRFVIPVDLLTHRERKLVKALLKSKS